MKINSIIKFYDTYKISCNLNFTSILYENKYKIKCNLNFTNFHVI